MADSLRLLLNDVLDYAGLFPPANLSLEDALRRYADQRTGEHGWMVARFVCPATILEGLDVYASLIFNQDGPPWRLAAVSRGGDDLESFLEVLQEDLQLVSSFSAKHRGQALVEMLEVKLPPAAVAAGAEQVAELAERSAEAIASITPGVRPFYEVSFPHGHAEKVAETLTALQKFNERWTERRYQPASAKLRAGGPKAELIPSTHHVAFFIAACRKLKLSFKATAGLHHPLRHQNTALGVREHGFLNLFAAAVFAYGLQTDLQTLVKVLEEEQASSFHLTDTGLTWNDLQASARQISAARKNFALSFGSCSVAEPVAGLQERGLL